MEGQQSIPSMAISIRGLAKQIGNRLILDDINLDVPIGEFYGILGPNGAGKSILLRTICGLVLPTKGEIYVFGERIGKDIEFPRDLGALIEGPGLLPQYNGFRNLELLSKIRNRIDKSRIVESIRLVGLDPYDRRPTKAYSTGMRQRLGIALAIMEKPKLLILDEPISGLDPQGIDDIHEVLKIIHDEGNTILITSHSREEIDLLCDKAFIITTGILSPINPPDNFHQPPRD